MYRAKVDAVDGWRVHTGGKWLQCIGNRAVHIGDFIWTDGRCVYGYDKEGSTPIVINNPEEKIFLPFSIKNDSVYYYKLPLKDFHTYKSTGIENFYKNCFFVNNSKGDYCVFAKSTTSRVIAANLTNNGDLYTISSLDGHRTLYNEPDVLLNYIVYRICIKKNETIIKTFDIYPVSDELETRAITLAESLKENSKPSSEYTVIYKSSKPVWGFIKDENNWAFIVWTSAEATCYSEFSWWMYGGDTLLTSAMLGVGLYYDSTGKALELYSFQMAEEYSRGNVGGVSSEDEPLPTDVGNPPINTANFNSLKGLKLPCQDNYYLLIEDLLIPPSNYKGSAMPKYGVFSVHSPDGKIICKFTSPLFPKVNIIKLKTQFIISVGWFLNLNEPDPSYAYPIDDTVANIILNQNDNAVFTVENGNLKFAEINWNSLWLKTTKTKAVKSIIFIDVEGIDLGNQ